MTAETSVMGLLRAIGDGFRRLLDFRGRDDRATFWPYALLIVVLFAFASALVLGPPLQATMRMALDYAAAHPDQAEIEAGSTGMSVRIRGFHPELFAAMIPALGQLLAVMLVAEALLAAAVARRLRDRDKAPYWGLLPVVTTILAWPLFSTLLNGATFNGGVFAALFINNLLYTVSLIWLIVQAAGPSATMEGKAP